MNTNDPGREPEPTDAELKTLHELREFLAVWVSDAMVLGNIRAYDARCAVNAAIAAHHVAKAAFRAMDDAVESDGGARIEKEGWAPLCDAMDEYESRMNGFCTSGARPMPQTPAPIDEGRVWAFMRDVLMEGGTVWYAPGTREEKHAITDGRAAHLTKKFLARFGLDSTPAPDEVAQLRAEVARLKDGLRSIVGLCDECNGVADAQVMAGRILNEQPAGGRCEPCEWDTRKAENTALTARIADLERDLKTAAGDYPVEMPEPGTPMAILLSANVLLKRENAALGAERDRLRRIVNATGSNNDTLRKKLGDVRRVCVRLVSLVQAVPRGLETNSLFPDGANWFATRKALLAGKEPTSAE